MFNNKIINLMIAISILTINSESRGVDYNDYSFNIKQLYTNDTKAEIAERIISEPIFNNEVKEEKVETNVKSCEVKQKNYEEVKLKCTFYGMGEDENGPGNGTLNCINGKLAPGTIATSENIPVGTIMYIPEIENFSGNENYEYTVLDRGNTKYIKQINESTHAIDIFVEQNKDESWDDYKQRISDLGVKETTGYILVEK